MIAAIYARKSTDLWSAVVAGWRWVDWTAVASLATFAAVVVALIPIFLAWRRDRAMRTLVRAQALTHLYALRRTFDGAVKLGLATYLVDIDIRADIDALRGLLPSGHFLAKGEANALIFAVSRLAGLTHAQTYSTGDAETLVDALDAATPPLERVPTTFGRLNLTFPWRRVR
jgi:hypothetical protein